MNDEAYVAFHGFVYLKGCSDTHKNGLQVQLLLDHEEDYKVFKDFRKHRKGKAGTGLYRALTRRGEGEWYGPVDLRFLRWTMSSMNGTVVTFEMDDPYEWRKMRDAPALDDGTQLEIMPKTEVMLIELDSEGKPLNVAQKAKVEKMALRHKWPKGGPQSIRAARLCNHTDFLGWLSQRGIIQGDVTPAEVAEWMRKECEIDSRAQLDHDPAALERFEDRVSRPFLRSLM